MRSFRNPRLVSRRLCLQRYARRPVLEELESRLVPAITFTQTNLVQTMPVSPTGSIGFYRLLQQ